MHLTCLACYVRVYNALKFGAGKLLTLTDTMTMLVLRENDVDAWWAWFFRHDQNDTCAFATGGSGSVGGGD